MYFLNLSTGACAPVYWRLPGDGTFEPQQVAFFKTYAEFAILLLAFMCDVIILLDVHTKHPHISIQ